MKLWTAFAAMCMIQRSPTHSPAMRTNIDIDDKLIAAAMTATGLPTKKATVAEALNQLVRRHQRLQALADMRGLGWTGDLAAQREGRAPDPQP